MIAGFELYTDLILADFLISCTPFVSEVVFQYVPLLIFWQLVKQRYH